MSSSRISQLRPEVPEYSRHQSAAFFRLMFPTGATPVTHLARFSFFFVKAEASGGQVRVSGCSGHQCHQCLPLVTKGNHQMRPRETSVSCPWAASLQQGDVISKVIVLVAQAAEAAPLAHH